MNAGTIEVLGIVGGLEIDVAGEIVGKGAQAQLEGDKAHRRVQVEAVLREAAQIQDSKVRAPGGNVAPDRLHLLLHPLPFRRVREIEEVGAISVVKRITVLDTTAGAVLFTLAAPDASMYGLVKTITFGTDNGDATLTLTNVQGGSAATTCTWANVGEELVLVGGASKWNVVSEGGVVLS